MFREVVADPAAGAAGGLGRRGAVCDDRARTRRGGRRVLLGARIRPAPIRPLPAGPRPFARTGSASLDGSSSGPSDGGSNLESVPDPATYRPAPGSIPVEPGVYRFRDPHGRVIYVGKAKSLRSRLNSYFADISGPGAAHPPDGDDRGQRRVDGGQHRSRGAAAGIQLDQGVRPAVQHPLPRRQVVSGAGGDAERGVSAADGVPRGATQGRPLLRAVLACLGHPRDARSAHPGVPGPHVFGGSLQAAQADRPAMPAGLHRQVLGAVHRTGHAPKSTGRSCNGLLRLPVRQDRPAGPRHGTADERGRRANWTSSGRPGCGTTSPR